MAVLSNTTSSLEFKLGGAAATNELLLAGSYAEMLITTGEITATEGFFKQSSGTTPVELIAAPAANRKRKLLSLYVVNLDTAAVTLTIQAVDSSLTPTTHPVFVAALAVGDQVVFSDAETFKIFDSTGALKEGDGGGTVTSVGIALDAPLGNVLGVSGSPVTTFGDITLTLDTQAANIVLAGPTSGGAAAPAFRALVTADVADGMITYAKMQNVSAESKLLGRGQGSGSGDVQELSLGTGLSLSGTTLSVSGSGVLTTLGDTLGHDGAAEVRVAGNTTTTRKFARQVGDGAASALHAWDTLQPDDYPLFTSTDRGAVPAGSSAFTMLVGSGSWGIYPGLCVCRNDTGEEIPGYGVAKIVGAEEVGTEGNPSFFMVDKPDQDNQILGIVRNTSVLGVAADATFVGQHMCVPYQNHKVRLPDGPDDYVAPGDSVGVKKDSMYLHKDRRGFRVAVYVDYNEAEDPSMAVVFPEVYERPRLLNSSGETCPAFAACKIIGIGDHATGDQNVYEIEKPDADNLDPELIIFNGSSDIADGAVGDGSRGPCDALGSGAIGNNELAGTANGSWELNPANRGFIGIGAAITGTSDVYHVAPFNGFSVNMGGTFPLVRSVSFASSALSGVMSGDDLTVTFAGLGGNGGMVYMEDGGGDLKNAYPYVQFEVTNSRLGVGMGATGWSSRIDAQLYVSGETAGSIGAAYQRISVKDADVAGTPALIVSSWNGSADTNHILLNGDGSATFNEQGNAVDFKVKGDTKDVLLIDGSADAAIIDGTLELADTTNIVANATTGSQIGTAASQKLGIWGTTAIVQPAHADQAALTDSTGGTTDGTVAAVSGTGDDATINNNFKEILTLLHAIRTAMVDFGSMKGSA